MKDLNIKINIIITLMLLFAGSSILFSFPLDSCLVQCDTWCSVFPSFMPEGIRSLAYSIISGVILIITIGKIIDRQLKDSIVTNIAGLNAKWLPQEYFENESKPSKKFDASVLGNLSKTSGYIYSGDTGNTSSERIHNHINGSSGSSKIDVTFYLINPTNQEVLGDLAKYRVYKEKGRDVDYSDSSLNDAKKEIIYEIIKTIMMLASIKTQGKVELFFVKKIPTFYIHHLDGCGIYMGFFLKGEYPQTVYYEKSSPYYDGIASKIEFEKRHVSVPQAPITLSNHYTNKPLNLQRYKGLDPNKKAQAIVDDLKQFMEKNIRGLESVLDENSGGSMRDLFIEKERVMEIYAKLKL